jgi:hypothetical protein
LCRISLALTLLIIANCARALPLFSCVFIFPVYKMNLNTGEYFSLTGVSFLLRQVFCIFFKNIIMEDVTAVMIELKEQALEATKKQDGQFYEQYLADTAIAVAPSGVYHKDDIIQLMSAPNPHFKSIAIKDTKTIVLSAESGMVTYIAVYENVSTKQQVEMFVSTVYAKIHHEWKGVFYQQTLLDTAP